LTSTAQVIDVLSDRRDLAAAGRFFIRALRAGTVPAEVTTDRAPAHPRVLEELIPSAMHTVERYANNPVETDHGRLKAPRVSANLHRRARPPCRTFAAATMNSPPTSLPVTASTQPSTSSR
jgi:transposase-like protein